MFVSVESHENIEKLGNKIILEHRVSIKSIRVIHIIKTYFMCLKN